MLNDYKIVIMIRRRNFKPNLSLGKYSTIVGPIAFLLVLMVLPVKGPGKGIGKFNDEKIN
jgi:hypothetical protein